MEPWRSRDQAEDGGGKPPVASETNPFLPTEENTERVDLLDEAKSSSKATLVERAMVMVESCCGAISTRHNPLNRSTQTNQVMQDPNGASIKSGFVAFFTSEEDSRDVL
ncbi:hypothetical protein L1987_05119 [Smallanthus sonchifolius]|uniref:Uncharacterized protein n=1 Tax=Smallanthus sonchifolius TaxID=185202 RepID=A0ACB9JUF5_9ASTR|nr:hypothetical protein L1987_05119 [Smallanthus sonchifolius]